MHSQVLLENNFITKKECKKLINFYKSKPLPEQFDSTFPLSLITTDYLNLIKKLNEVSIKLNNSVVDYFQIVKWPSPNIGKVLHLDHAHSHTSLSSIIYLNDEFEGGHTYFEDKTSFPIFHEPRTGARATKLKMKTNVKENLNGNELIHFRPQPGTLIIFPGYLEHEFSIGFGIEPFRFIHWNIQAIPKGMAKDV